MSKSRRPLKAADLIAERSMTGLFSRAFSQPLKLLGQTEASLSSYAVFWCVADNEGATQVEVSRLTGLSAKTVSRVISQLGESRGGKGWIRQDFDDADRRVRRLYLTRSGKSLLNRLLKDLSQVTGNS